MAMQYDGKTYRNLQEQVAYLTGKWQELANEIDELRAQIPSKMIVEELPETGDPLITYYVGPKGTEPNLYYEVWIWVQEEPDGPFVWRELEDTDQVDLSGYLPIQDGATALPQVYTKNADGTQAMVDADTNASGGSIAKRKYDGRLNVVSPLYDNEAANKKYCDDGFVAKQTGSTSERQVYSKAADGTQTMLDAAQNVVGGALPIRSSTGHLLVPDNPNNDSFATNKKYVDTNFLAKQTGATSYPQIYGKNTDGSQLMFNVSAGEQGSTIPMRKSDGNITVSLTPSANGDAASKAYVDATVGQLLYLHDIEIIVTVDATNKLFVKAYLVNGSSTAITSINDHTFMRMDVQYGCFGQDIQTGTPCAVTKYPNGFGHDHFDEPRPAYLYQYMSGGSLVSGATTTSMTVTFTDTVINF